MSVWNWVEIIARIILLIAEGMSKEDAVRKASSEFGVSENEIWKRGGF
ncbi:MAG: hypothetical protein IBX50_12060 [Marinospirillum sp.]|nr:hypothetical protein [Marinospirillum sp.]MBE0507430.1 hypothetical protein [Marinospirillum sp.]